MGPAALESKDPTIYPEEERVGEEMLQRWVAELLRPLLERFLNRSGAPGPSFVGADQFIYYRQHDPHRRFAPDVYVLPGVPPQTRVRSWKTWEEGRAPSFALEVVSSDWQKDYVEAPTRCAEAGVEELVVFDPSWAERPGKEGARWQVYRRGPTGFEKVAHHDRDRVQVETLGAWLRVVGFGDRTLLRIATGDEGEALFPTAAEEALAEAEEERAAKEEERAAKEEALAEVEAERAAKEDALARLGALEAELLRLKRG